MTTGHDWWLGLAGAASALSIAVPLQAQGQAAFTTATGLYAAPVTSLRDMPFRTVVRQQYDYSCGSAALATLLRHHYGRPVDEAQVFRAMYAVGDQAQIRRVGFSLLDMKTYLHSVGLPAEGYRESLADLQRSGAPAIAVINIGAYRHFVVVKGVAGGRVLVGDPALGLKTYAAKDFLRMWNGVVLTVRDGPQAVAFNRPEEWGAFPRGRTDALTDASLARLTLGLPTIYQPAAFRTFP